MSETSAGAILLAAGRGERLGLGPKGLIDLAGRPLFAWALAALQQARAIAGIVVVGPVAELRAALAQCGGSTARVVAWCEGGTERQHSVANGLAALPREFELVAVHDAARALVAPALIEACVAAAAAHGAAIAAAPLEDTIKRARDGVVLETVPRAGLWRVQTPQVFRRDWLERAHAAAHVVATDDAALVESAGHPVRIVASDASNFKITTRADHALAEAWLASTGRAAR